MAINLGTKNSPRRGEVYDTIVKPIGLLAREYRFGDVPATRSEWMSKGGLTAPHHPWWKATVNNAKALATYFEHDGVFNKSNAMHTLATAQGWAQRLQEGHEQLTAWESEDALGEATGASDGDFIPTPAPPPNIAPVVGEDSVSVVDEDGESGSWWGGLSTNEKLGLGVAGAFAGGALLLGLVTVLRGQEAPPPPRLTGQLPPMPTRRPRRPYDYDDEYGVG